MIRRSAERKPVIESEKTLDISTIVRDLQNENDALHAETAQRLSDSHIITIRGTSGSGKSTLRATSWRSIIRRHSIR